MESAFSAQTIQIIIVDGFYVYCRRIILHL